MNDTENMSPGQRILFYTIFASITIAHFFLTFVVTLLLLSTLNILNERTLHIGKLDYIEGAVVVLIFGASVWVFFRSFKKASATIKETFFRGPSA